MTETKRNTFCLYCGGTMAGARAGAEWCSASCRVQGNRAMARERAAGSPYDNIMVLRGLGISIKEPIKMHVGGVPRKKGAVKTSGSGKRSKRNTKGRKGAGV